MDSADGLIEAAEATGNPSVLAFALAVYGVAFRERIPSRFTPSGLVIVQDSGNRAVASAMRFSGTI